MSLQEFKDNLAISIYGITANDAHVRGICISCKQVPTHESTSDLKEWRISGLCGACFDNATYAADSEPYDEGKYDW
jgi:hypothetical protein